MHKHNIEDNYVALDGLRAWLMMLGVIFHSAQVFNPSKEWLVNASSSSNALAVLASILHTFRMPMFFVIAGFFTTLMLSKYTTSFFLKQRLKRLVIPFFVAALTINTLQAIVIHYFGWKEINLTSYIVTGEYVQHLWFLINLLVYMPIVVIFKQILPISFVNNVVRYTKSNPWYCIFAWLTLAPLFTLFGYSLNKVGVPIYDKVVGLCTPIEILIYVPFFVFGMWFWLVPNLFRDIRSRTLVALTLGFIIAWISARHWQAQSNTLETIFYTYSNTVAAWLSVPILFAFGQRLFRSRNKISSFIADASYTVYLFHQLLIVFFVSVLFAKSTLSPWLAFSLLVVLTSVTALLIHSLIISKSETLKFLFNGR